MDILDKKSAEVISFFTVLDEMLESIRFALKDRSSTLNGERYLTNRDVSQMLSVSIRCLQEWRDKRRRVISLYMLNI
ncbi:hypothetical protein CLV62_14419 [Dysgonomonas alginatilytica]|uniref:DNA-binding protein n=1 Tax=Dysgonomonas alginatilytica TaxID=1605892 RepID=A0A2V3PHY4_9BACT|nr:hypothetical protein CLV62_14419 [Dysgonomonas alginatilytica]